MYFYICTSIYTHIFCIFVIGLKKKCFDQLKPSVPSQWSPGYFLQLIFAVRLAIIKLQDSLDSFKMHNDKPMCNLQRSSFSRCHWMLTVWYKTKKIWPLWILLPFIIHLESLVLVLFTVCVLLEPSFLKINCLTNIAVCYEVQTILEAESVLLPSLYRNKEFVTLSYTKQQWYRI